MQWLMSSNKYSSPGQPPIYLSSQSFSQPRQLGLVVGEQPVPNLTPSTVPFHRSGSVSAKHQSRRGRIKNPSCLHIITPRPPVSQSVSHSGGAQNNWKPRRHVLLENIIRYWWNFTHNGRPCLCCSGNRHPIDTENQFRAKFLSLFNTHSMRLHSATYLLLWDYRAANPLLENWI